MATRTAATTSQAQEIWELVGKWRDRASELGAVKQNGSSDAFIISGDTGAFRIYVEREHPGQDKGFYGSIYWSSLTDYPDSFWIGPDVLDCGQRSAPERLGVDAAQAVIDALQPGVSEIAPQVRVPYGFVADGEIVAVTCTTDVYEGSLTNRSKLGLNEDTYVAYVDAFQRLSPPQANRADWYGQFWALQEQGSVVKLSARVKQLPAEVWSYRNGPNTWLEFGGTDGSSPSFLVSQPYVSWVVATNQPSQRVRGDGSSLKLPLRGWFK